MTMKKCTKCGAQKPLEEFYPATKRKGGKVYHYHQSRCKDCVRAMQTARMSAPDKRAAAREYARNRGDQYRQRERERIAERQGREYKSAKQRADESAERKAALDADRERQKREKERRILDMPWTNPALSKAERFKLRYELDSEFNLKQRVRAALRRKRQGIRLGCIMRAAVNRNGNSPTAEAFLGYSMFDLRKHLERQFTNKMTWDAFRAGQIHIDHIVPLASFDLSNPNELRRAWCMTNLRPVWASVNLRKAARLEYLL